MPDRTATPEELLDQWLDALNEPGVAPPPPAAIAGLAEVALDYRRALAPSGNAAAAPERNGKMHHAQTLATSNSTSWRILAQPKRQKAGWSSWLATAAVFALLVGLIGGAAMRTWGLPGRDDPGRLAGVAASPGATPAGGTLSCASPEYLAVVSGNPDAGDLAMVGGPDRVIRSTDDGVFVPLVDGETRELPPDSMIYPDSDLALAIHNDNSATATRISTGETWEYSAVKPRVEEQRYWDFFSNGRYVIGPTDDSRTDWLITDVLTGDTRTTADILGERFDGPLDLWMQSTSENGDFWLLQFMTLTFPDYDETPPAGNVYAPGYLVIPGSLDDAWFSDTSTSVEPVDAVVSPEGTSFIVNQTVRDPKTGERLDRGEDNPTYFGELIGYLDEDTLLTRRHDTLNRIDIHTAVASPIYTAPAIIQSVALDFDAGMLAIGSGSRVPTTWVLLDLTTGKSTPLPALGDYHLANASSMGRMIRVDNAAAFTRPEAGGDISVRALDMRTGAVSDPVTTRTDTRVDGLQASVPAWGSGRFIRTTDDAGTPVFIDSVSGITVALPIPNGAEAPDGGYLDVSVVPGENCATLTPLGADNEPVGNTWIAPIESGATWTELPFSIDGWLEVNVEEPRILPAQDFATPAAATPAGTFSCASPGYRAVVRGAVNPAGMTMLGNDPIDLAGDSVTAANGTEITFGPDDVWTIHWASSVILSGENERALNTVTSLATGRSWTFPVLVENSPESQAVFMLLGGPWLIGATDDTATDWRIVNIFTGEERLTSDILGASFGQPPVPIVAPWLDPAETPRMIAFSGDSPTPSVVLPTADLNDAWALPDAHVLASATGVITPDGSRIVYFLPSADDTSSVVTVLDGFSGEEIATWPGPETGDVLRTVGLTAGDGKMILRDSQTVWTVDIETGEIATVFDPEGQIYSFAFDPTTGTALATAGDDAFYWIDPATGELKPLDIPVPMRFPQPQFGWALVQTRDDIAVDFALLDMATGEIVTEPIAADRDENGTNVWITGGDDTGVFVVQAEPGRMLVLDGPGGQAFALSAPDTGRDGWDDVSIGVSPNGGCLVYTEVDRGDEPGTSWIAPLEPDAEWTALPFELGPWIEMPPAQTAPAATPNATETPVPTVTPLPVETPIIKPLPPTATAATADPDIVGLLPGDAIPVVATDDPESVDQNVFATVGGLGPDSPPGMTIPLRNGEVLKLPDAIAIAQLPLTSAALVTNDDGSRLTIDLTSGETLFDFLPPAAEGEQWVGHYLLIPARDGTIWRVIDLLTGDQTDTATLGSGPFDRPVTVVPMPSPADAPRNVVVQFAFETSTGDLMPWQGLATDAGPPSGVLIIPGSLEDARFLDATRFATIDSADPMHPTIAISGGDRPLVAQVTRLANGRIVVEDAITGESVASWQTFRAPETTDVTIAGFGPDGTSLIAWLSGVKEGLPDQVIWMHWDGHPAQMTETDIETGRIQQVIPAFGQFAFVAILTEPGVDAAAPEWLWKRLDLESGELADLPQLDGMWLDRYLRGEPWMIFNDLDATPSSSSTVIVDAATGEVAARLDDANLGMATARSSSRDGGVLVVTGHTGDEYTTGYVIDADSGESWALEPPFEGQVWFGVSPDGSVLTASTDAGDGWIAPVAEGAAWIPLPEGPIVDWIWLPEDGG